MVISAYFCNALSYAAALRAQQTRKASGQPYLAHLLAVCALVMEHGGSEDAAIAALLHDAVEELERLVADGKAQVSRPSNGATSH